MVELLVVIAIIAILAALLLSALANSKTQARQVACLNNIKQITEAGLMYMSDTADLVPYDDPTLPGYDPNTPSEWIAALSNDGGIDQVRLCPSTRQPPPPLPNSPTAGKADLAWIASDRAIAPVIGNYAVNGWLVHIITSYPPVTPYAQDFFNRPSSVQKPSFTPFFCDAIYANAWPLESDKAATDLYVGQNPIFSTRMPMGTCTILRHGGPTATSSVIYKPGTPLPGAINMGFDDGHGELVKLQSLWTYSWHLNWNHP